MNQSKHPGIRYPEEFDKSSAKLAIEADQVISKTAKDLNVDPATLRSWINACRACRVRLASLIL